MKISRLFSDPGKLNFLQGYTVTRVSGRPCVCLSLRPSVYRILIIIFLWTFPSVFITVVSSTPYGSRIISPRTYIKLTVSLEVLAGIQIQCQTIFFLASPAWLRGERVGHMTWCLWVRDPLAANFISSVFSPLTAAEAFEKSGWWLFKEICVRTGVRRSGNSCASPTAMIWP